MHYGIRYSIGFIVNNKYFSNQNIKVCSGVKLKAENATVVGSISTPEGSKYLIFSFSRFSLQSAGLRSTT